MKYVEGVGKRRGRTSDRSEEIEKTLRGMSVDQIIYIDRHSLGYKSGRIAYKSVRRIAEDLAKRGRCSYDVKGTRHNGKNMIRVHKTLEVDCEEL